MRKSKTTVIIFSLVILLAGLYFAPQVFPASYSSKDKDTENNDDTQSTETVDEETVESPQVFHIETPEVVKAIYLTSWAAGTKSLRDSVVSVIDTTEVNAVVIDIKDYSGKIAFEVNDPVLAQMGVVEKRISDIDGLIKMLHEKNIYVIGRISVFQDASLVKIWPEEAVKTATDKSKVWKDRKGISWMDAGSPKVWDYVARIGDEAYSRGFDELNFDYIRFPSDGNMKDIYFPVSEGRVKQEVLGDFFSYLDKHFEGKTPISGDLFGMTTTNTDDLGIGQNLEIALTYLDYVCPMVYPSHYPSGWNGFANPAEKPYEVISIAMKNAVSRANAIGIDPNKLRPWLQDFDLGATYTKEMVREQISATYDSGLDSWLVWDAANTYTPGAFLPS